LKSGGGIGDLTVPPIYDGTYRPYVYLLYLFLFFIIFPVLLMSIVTGIILDTFANMRETREKIEADQEGKCFICGMTRGDLDKIPGGFERHASHEHNMWNYLYYMKHVALTPRTMRTGLESYVAECLDANEPRFFPIQRSIAVEFVGDRGARARGEGGGAGGVDERSMEDGGTAHGASGSSADSVKQLLADLPATVINAVRSQLSSSSNQPPKLFKTDSGDSGSPAASFRTNARAAVAPSSANPTPSSSLVPPVADEPEVAQLKRQIVVQQERLSEMSARLVQMDDRGAKMERLLVQILSASHQPPLPPQQQERQHSLNSQQSIVVARESSTAANGFVAATTSVEDFNAPTI
jgi:hypothetical protein